MVKSLHPTKQKAFKQKIAGFDIETYSNKNKFLCASVYHDDEHIFFSKDINKIKEHFKSDICRNKIISATNLNFDFFGLFGVEAENFELLLRQGELLSAKSYVYENEFIHPLIRKELLNKCKSRQEYKALFQKFFSLTFIDSMAYNKFSVENLGEIIGIKKLHHPKCFGRKPESDEEWEELEIYNIQDSKITKMFIDFLYKGLLELGCSIKSTIGSCTMSLFKNKYLTEKYYTHDKDDILKLFNAYYGGRTEAFKVGTLLDYSEESYKLYDINSLYPYAMKKEFPNPNSMCHSEWNSIQYIEQYEGISDVTVSCPYMKYPLLPFRTKDKLIFPVGKTWRSFYTHIELRKAVQLGYKIIKTHETYYFKEKIKPFEFFVDDLYNKRNEYKKDKSEMEIICKLLMNSLYGKFGQKFLDKENIVSASVFNPEDKKYKSFDFYNEHFIRTIEDRNPSAFCFPEWASYVTAYGRLELYDYIINHNPVYCDTDSIITRSNIETSDELGKMKLEMEIKKGIIIKPKFYAIINKSVKPMFCKKCGYMMDLINNDTNIFECKSCGIKSNRNKIKIKGVSLKLNFEMFNGIVFNKEHKVIYEKFIKFKESMIRKLDVNEIIPIIKVLKLNDNKRMWGFNVDYSLINDSEPIDITNLNLKPILYNEQNEFSLMDEAIKT